MISEYPVEPWLKKLSLDIKLSEALRCNSLDEVIKLNSEELSNVSRRYCEGFDEFLHAQVASLKDALDKLAIAKEDAASGKFKMYPSNYGAIEDFHKLLYEEIGAPNPDWLQGTWSCRLGSLLLTRTAVWAVWSSDS